MTDKHTIHHTFCVDQADFLPHSRTPEPNPSAGRYFGYFRLLADEEPLARLVRANLTAFQAMHLHRQLTEALKEAGHL